MILTAWNKFVILELSRPHAINWKFNRFLICIAALKSVHLPHKACYCYCCHFTIHFCVWHKNFETRKFTEKNHEQFNERREQEKNSTERIKKHFTSSANWYGTVAQAKQQFQLIFKFNVSLFLFFRARTTWLHRRGHPKQVAGESVNLLSKKPKKRVWKVKAAPENDEDEEEGIKEVGWVWVAK